MVTPFLGPPCNLGAGMIRRAFASLRFFMGKMRGISHVLSAVSSSTFFAALMALFALMLALMLAMTNLPFYDYDLAAQPRGQDSARSTRGKDFRLTFLPNFHDPSSGTRPVINDSLFIFITCDKPTRGTITFRDRNGATASRAVTITNPAEFFILGLPFNNFELQGFNAGGTANAASQNERVAPQSFRIVTDDEVTVYALNQARFTSDAALILPVTALGRDYRVMAYESDATGAPNALTLPGPSTPSQFAVVASANNTVVRITPTAPTPQNPTGGTVTVLMNEGDSYLVQADPRVQNGYADLTGSRVQADKPVSVFGSHQRTTLPVRQREILDSRDHLWEQMPGVETWGKQAFITPFVQARASLLIGNDLYRVLAAYDDTRVSVNGRQVAVLRAGQFYEAPLVDAAWITATDQILVAQYKKTSNNSAGAISNTSRIGDPFMIVIPGTEQYDNSYRFINVRVRDGNVDGGEVFADHFVTVVAPTTFTETVRIDERLVGAQAFQPIVNSGYSFANIQLAAGVHTARADTGIGIYVYGYGPANSYGYVGGGKLRFIAPDRDQPEITSAVRCFEAVGVVYDTLATDSRIAQVEILSTTLANVTATAQAFTPFADSVSFSGRLQNIFQDGSFGIRARDSIGFVTTRTIPIYGFTVGLEGQSVSLAAPERRYTMTTGRSRVFPLVLVNYGSTTQTITTLRFANAGSAGNPAAGGYFITDRLPITLLPSSRATVNVRFASTQNGIVADTLIIGSTCATRAVAALSVESGIDTEAPRAARNDDRCARTITFTFTDDDRYDSGIARVEALELRNFTFRADTLGVFNAFNPQDSTGRRVATARLRVQLSVIDPRLDAIYSLCVADSAGNARIFRDTVSGLTLRLVPQRAAATVLVPNPPDTSGQFGGHGLTQLICRDLIYTNIGLQPFVLPILAPRGNRYFSMPVPQFPIVFQPGETRRIQLCFSPLEARNYRDTLLIENFCAADTLILTGAGVPLTSLENTRCDVVVRLTTSGAPQDYFTEQNFPNPASALTTIVLGLPEQTSGSSVNVTVRLYNALGTYIATLADGVYPSGLLEITADVSRLESGAYFYEARVTTNVQNGSGANASVMRVVKQLNVAR